MRRRTVVGIPLVLTTVYARQVLAQEPISLSGCASIAPSGWRARNPDTAPLCDTAPEPLDAPETTP